MGAVNARAYPEAQGKKSRKGHILELGASVHSSPMWPSTTIDDESDPDGLEQAARMALEEKAVDFILSRHPNWKRAPTHNPGFDLFESGLDGNPVRWCEVKAMTGSLDERPIGLSRTQFEYACKYGANYWLYVVERAGDEMLGSFASRTRPVRPVPLHSTVVGGTSPVRILNENTGPIDA